MTAHAQRRIENRPGGAVEYENGELLTGSVVVDAAVESPAVSRIGEVARFGTLERRILRITPPSA